MRKFEREISRIGNAPIRVFLSGTPILTAYGCALLERDTGTPYIDIAEIDGLNNHVKRIIRVPNRCFKDCSHIETCSYLRFRKEAESIENDIQVCNHNYLLADTIRKTSCEKPLIPNYQCIIIDEAQRESPLY